jgi:type I restriction enzyme S subunit
MADEWPRHEVSQLMADGKLVIGDGYRAKNEELASIGLPFARAGNINDGFRFDDADHFPEESLARVGNKVSQAGDVVFTSKGTVGRFAFVHATTPRFVYSPQLCFWRSLDHKAIDPQFLYYWMFGREFFVQFKAWLVKPTWQNTSAWQISGACTSPCRHSPNNAPSPTSSVHWTTRSS